MGGRQEGQKRKEREREVQEERKNKETKRIMGTQPIALLSEEKN